MKEGTTITKLVMLFLVACLAAYFGVYIVQGLTDDVTTAVAYTYTVNDSVETDGLLVRQEEVLPGYSGIVNVMPGEGERVGAGQTVAVIYRDGDALAREDEIQALTMEAELLQYAMSQPTMTGGAGQLEDQVFRAAVDLRTSTAAGEFGRLEDQVLELKRSVLRRDYTYGQSADDGRLGQLNDRLRQLRSRSAMDTSRVLAEQAGVYSALVDGYEGRITPEGALVLTASMLDDLLEQEMPVPENSLGKLITANRWYAVVALPEARAEKLARGRTLLVGFSGDFERIIEMRIDHISKAEDGRCAVTLSTDRFLSETTLLRTQTLEIIFDRQEGLRVPKAAVHILMKETEDDAGNLVQTTTTGVYAVVNGQAEFKKVEVLAEGRQFYVVRPLDEGKTVLRAGDQVIVRAKGLHDGKVLSE
ncbi:MAG: hypothetical protein IJA11_05910 [Oscillospiraceae bacterium]|nr:hypothetical protein [Oscillospiraceae bacterium]